MTALPNNWVVANLGTVATFVRGVTYKKPQARADPAPGYIPLLRATNIDGERLILDDDLIYVPEELVKQEQLLRLGDVVVATSSGSLSVVGKSARLRQDWNGTFGAFCGVIRSGSRVSPVYVAHLVQHEQVRRTWSSAAQGTNINNLKPRDIQQTLVPLPPVEEQWRIVEAIEEQLSRLDAAEESLRRANRNLGRYRLAALLSEIEGNWERRPLGDLLVSLKNGLFISRPAAEPPGIPIFRISAVRPMWLNVEDVRYAAVDATNTEGYFVEEGDLLFTRYSGNPSFVGACARVPHLEQPTLHPDKLIRAVVNDSVVDSAYLEITLSVGEAQREIEKRRKTTAGQVGISGSQLRSVLVPTPPLDIQREVVANVRRQASVSEALDRYLTTSLQRVKSLRSAVLRDAFAGCLVTQDPSDDPVSAFPEAVRS